MRCEDEVQTAGMQAISSKGVRASQRRSPLSLRERAVVRGGFSQCHPTSHPPALCTLHSALAPLPEGC
jgi:hypothetical protein